LYEEEGPEKHFGRADRRSRVGEEKHARMPEVAMRLRYPVAYDAGGNTGAATLRFCLDQRAKINERHRCHRRSRLVVSDGLVRCVGREQALDQRGPAALWSIIKVKGVDRIDGPRGQHQAEGLADEMAALPDNPGHHQGSSREIRTEELEAPDRMSVEP
jgi:hypothetical protein